MALIVIFLLLLFGSIPAQAAISVPIAVSFDGTFDGNYPLGDKPPPLCDPPSGWTEANVGAGSGEICEQSATEWDFSVLGNSNNTVNHFAYKDAGGGDVQFVARITDSYAGSVETTAAVGIGIRESTGQSSWQYHVHSLQNGSTAVRVTYGDSSGGFTNVAGAIGQSRPRYVCINYHLSTNELVASASADGSEWVEIDRQVRVLSNDLAYAFGSSGSVVDTFQATMDNIALGSTVNCSDPTEEPPLEAPILVTPIPNSSGTQAVAFSLDISANFTGETSYSISGLQAGTALSFNTSTGVLSGTPDADDVGNYNVTITATNLAGSTPDTFSLTIASAPSGDILTIPTNGGAFQTIDCDTFESGGRVDPGDILQFNGTEYGPLTIRDCQGDADNPIIIRNDPNDALPATIKRSTTGKSFVLEITNSDNIEVTGVAWSGGPTRTCGVEIVAGAKVEGRLDDGGADDAACGIVLTKTGGVSQPTYYLRVNGTSCTPNCRFEGMAADALANSDGTGICYSLNDHTVLYASNPLWREGIYFVNNYGNRCGAEGEGFYVGPNEGAGDLPLRDVHFLGNLIDDGGRECMNVKSVWAGDNTFNDNHCYRPGLPQAGTQDDGFNIMSTASWEIKRNLVVGAGGACLHLQYDNGDGHDTASPDSTFTVENNIFVDCGQNNANDDYGIDASGGAAPSDPIVNIRNNTIVSNADGPIAMSTIFVGTCTSANNIHAGNGNANNASNCSETNNLKDTIANLDFVNDSLSAGDFHLTSSSPACSNANSNSPADDFDGQTRTGTDDQGADQAAACP